MPDFSTWTALDWVAIPIVSLMIVLAWGTAPAVAMRAKVGAKVRESDAPPALPTGLPLLKILEQVDKRIEVLEKEINARELEKAELKKMLGVRHG